MQAISACRVASGTSPPSILRASRIGIDVTDRSKSGSTRNPLRCSSLIPAVSSSSRVAPMTGWLNQSPTVESRVSSGMAWSPVRVMAASPSTVAAFSPIWMT